jgi:hypothetical protein
MKSKYTFKQKHFFVEWQIYLHSILLIRVSIAAVLFMEIIQQQ